MTDEQRPIENLYEYLQSAHPSATVELTRPLREDGFWSLDVDMGDVHLAIQWNSRSGFGISTVSRDNFGEGPDEVSTSFESAKLRVRQLLSGSERTSPPSPVLISRLRQRMGVTQRAANCHADLVAAEACRLALDDNKPMSTAKMWELGAVVRAALAKAQGRKRND